MRGGRRERGKCDRCGRDLSLQSDGSGQVAHKCPHGAQCVRPAWTGSKALGCELCAAVKLAAPS